VSSIIEGRASINSRVSAADSITDSIASEIDRGAEAAAVATAAVALTRGESGTAVAAAAAAAEGRRLVTRTAALLVVGDEILSGDTRDENSLQVFVCGCGFGEGQGYWG
jgi:hypothetical protein